MVHGMVSRLEQLCIDKGLKMTEQRRVVARHDCGDGRARYEEMPSDHHDHLIDVQTGRVIEFRNEEIEKLQRFVASELGYKLIDHRLELFAVPIEPSKPRKP